MHKDWRVKNDNFGGPDCKFTYTIYVLHFFKANQLYHYNINHTISGCLKNVSVTAEPGKNGNLLRGIDKKTIRREEILICLIIFSSQCT